MVKDAPFVTVPFVALKKVAVLSSEKVTVPTTGSAIDLPKTTTGGEPRHADECQHAGVKSIVCRVDTTRR
jgi:hypothetical protein